MMQESDYAPAVDVLTSLIEDYQSHPLHDAAVLARGICLRRLGEYDRSKADLEYYLTRSPTDTNLGHALYELALIEQKNQLPGRAAQWLRRLVNEVPEYPAIDKVLYELGWSLQQSGEEQEAVEHFASLVSKYPQTDLAADAAYYIGQTHYAAEQWQQAAERFRFAAGSDDPDLVEKALYRLGWSLFNSQQYDAAQTAFTRQFDQRPQGNLAFDAVVMVGECHFKREEFDQALAAYEKARQRMVANDETSSSIRDDASRQVRELALLHGGQSASQLEQWDTAIAWHDEHRERFPSSSYLPQVFYETGFAYHQKGNLSDALRFYSQVADKYRNDVGARSRFMIGEIYFAQKAFDKAIPEFQRVMFGYGAESAPDEIKNWQAKSGFEAGRCSESLMQAAKTKKAEQKAREFALTFYSYVVEKHPNHEVAKASRDRQEALSE